MNHFLSDLVKLILSHHYADQDFDFRKQAVCSGLRKRRRSKEEGGMVKDTARARGQDGLACRPPDLLGSPAELNIVYTDNTPKGDIIADGA